MKTQTIYRILAGMCSAMILIAMILIAMNTNMAINNARIVDEQVRRIEALEAQLKAKDASWAAAANRLAMCRETQHAQMMRVRPK